MDVFELYYYFDFLARINSIYRREKNYLSLAELEFRADDQ